MSTALQEQTTPASTARAATIAELVHKTRTAEVLLTGWRTTGPDTHHVSALLPSTHGFYRPRAGFHDPLLLAEAVRQSIPLLSHAVYGAPFGDHQAWRNLDMRLDPAALAVGAAPTVIDMRTTFSDVVRRAGRLAAAKMQVQITAAGRHLATVTTEFTNHSPAIYNRLRGERADLQRSLARLVPLAPPLPPAQVARTDFRDVVLSATGSTDLHLLRVDPTHPGLFDHPVDHAPGMLLLEAVRQAAHLASARPDAQLVALAVVFTRYAEFDTPCMVQSVPLPVNDSADACFMVSAEQNGECIMAATVELQSPADR